MVMQSISKIQEALQHPDVRATLGNVFDTQILKDLPYILRVAKQHVKPGGAAEEVVEFIKEKDDPKPIQEIIDAGECDVNAFCRENPLIHHAVGYRRPKVFQYLVQHSLIDINIRDSTEWRMTPLHLAVRHRQADEVKLLLKHQSIDVNIKDSKGRFPLLMGLDDANIEEILLADARVDVHMFAPRPPKTWKLQDHGPPICLTKNCGKEMSLRTGGYQSDVWICGCCGQPHSINTPRYFCCAEHQNDICKSCAGLDKSHLEFPRITALHYCLEVGHVHLVCQWLKHPDLDVNKHDIGGCPPVFHCFGFRVSQLAGAKRIDHGMINLDTLLADQRTILSFRDADGGSVVDFFKHIFSIDPILDGSGRLPEALSVVRRHERVRLQRAKIPVKILKDWRVETTPGNTMYFPEEVLSKYVLPHLADVVSPFEEIGGAGLQ